MVQKKKGLFVTIFKPKWLKYKIFDVIFGVPGNSTFRVITTSMKTPVMTYIKSNDPAEFKAFEIMFQCWMFQPRLGDRHSYSDPTTT